MKVDLAMKAGNFAEASSTYDEKSSSCASKGDDLEEETADDEGEVPLEFFFLEGMLNVQCPAKNQGQAFEPYEGV